MIKRLIPILLLAVVITLGAMTFRHYFEPYEEVIDEGYSRAAQRNPFLAAEQFLQHRAPNATSATHLNALNRLDQFDTLILPDSDYLLSESRQNQVLGWIRDGGHLIVSVAEDDDFLSRHFTLERVKVTLEDNETENASPVNALSRCEKNSKTCEPRSTSELLREFNEKLKRGEIEFAEDGSLATNDSDEVATERLTQTYFNNIQGVIVAHFNNDYALHHPFLDADDENSPTENEPFYFATDGHEYVHLMQFSVGDGLLTVLSDTELWLNDGIGQFDHALLLDTLAGDQTLIIHGQQSLSLWQLIWRWAPELVLTIIALGLASVWWRGLRIGPLRDLAGAEHRALGDYLLAEGRYLSHCKSSSELLRGIRTDILQRAIRRIAQFEQLNRQQQTERLARLVGATATQVNEALFNNQPQSIRQLQHDAALLQRLRKQL